jgi:hypothetical protein
MNGYTVRYEIPIDREVDRVWRLDQVLPALKAHVESAG